MTNSAAHREAPWPVLRNITSSVLDFQRPHTVYGFGEVNASAALAAIERCRRQGRTAVSLHAFVLYCLARATAEHPAVHTFRRRRKLITFEEVDVGTMIEKRQPDGTRMPVGYVVRSADRKSLAEINWELRQAAKRDLSDDPAVRFRRRLARLPAFLRRILFRRALSDPFRLRRVYGTIGLTSLQTAALPQPFFALPPNLCTLTVAIGSLTDRFLPDAAGRPVLQKVLCLGGGADHDVVDGMTLVRFGNRFAELIETAAGLDDVFVAQTRSLRTAASS